MKKLGFGLMRLPIIDNNDEKINLKEFKLMADEFIKNGFTYFDTAYFYHNGLSEGAFNKAVVKRYPRDAYTITDKLPIYQIKKEKDNEIIFNRQLKRLGVDYVDYYLMHAVNLKRFNNVKDLGTFEFMQKVKKQGKAKHIGFSYHDSAKNLDYILSVIGKWVDVVQLQINYLDWLAPSVEAKKCYEVCRKYKKKVIIMEPVKGGRLARLSDECRAIFDKLDKNASNASFAIRYAASLDGVIMVLSGMSNLQQLKDNTSFMKHFKKLDDKELKAVNKVAKIIKNENKIECTACRYCTENCPSQIPIPDIFAFYNNPYHSLFDYKAITKDKGKASDCTKCGVCEANCPQHLKIRDNLEKIARDSEN